MKQFDIKDIKSWANCCDVKIGDEGYFISKLDRIEDEISNKSPECIKEILSLDSNCFVNSYGVCYGFFLPADKVREEKKKYRPVRTVEDLCKLLGKNKCINPILSSVTIRRKIDLTVIYDTVITGWARQDDNTIKLIYMNRSWCLSPDELLKDSEIKINGEWKPFGAEDETK